MTDKSTRRTDQRTVEPIAYTIDDAVQASGFSRTRVYAAMRSGELASFKAGKRRLIRADSLRALIDSLSAAAAA